MGLKNNNSLKLVFMMILTLITQVFILLRVSIIASKFGVSMELDAFNFANSIGTLTFSFITTGITTILIPNLGNEEDKGSVDTFITTLYLIGTGLLVFGIIFRKQIVRIFSENNNSEFLEIASLVLIIVLIGQYIASFIGLSNAVLQYQNKFNRTKIAILIANGLTVVILLLKENLNVYDYANALLITSIVNIIFQFIFMFLSGFRFKITLKNRSEKYKKMIRSFLPIVMSTGLYQVSLMIDISIASGLGEGSISILNYSNYVIGMVNMLLIANITTFLYPKIAKNIKSEKSQEQLANYIVIINTIVSLIVVGVIVVGKDVLNILYGRGELGFDIIQIIYMCTIGYIIALPMSAVRDLIYKYFYANNDTKTPFKNSLMISILNITISIILAQFIGIYGVVLGTSITSIMSLTFISLRFRKKFSFKFDTKVFLKDNIKILLASIISVGVAGISRNFIVLNNNILEILLFGIIVVLTYVMMLFILKSRVFKMKL